MGFALVILGPTRAGAAALNLPWGCENDDAQKSFPVGSIAQIRLAGDEIKHLPSLAAAGAVTSDSLVLVAKDRDGDWEPVEVYRAAVRKYREAVDTEDRAAMERLIKEGGAFRVKQRVGVRVRESWPRTTEWRAGLPSDPGGLRRVEILAGENKGRVGLVPARNLVTPDENSVDRLSALAPVAAQEKAISSKSNPDRLPIKYAAEEGIPKDRAAEKRRDYAVLEATLNDLTSPRNPEHKRRFEVPRREIVVNLKTIEFELDPDWDGETRNFDGVDARTVPAEILADLRRRSREPVKSLMDFRPANRDIIVTDLDRTTEDAANRGEDSDETFRKEYPTAWGYVWARLPGYSKDGRTAVVLFDGGPFGGHGLGWVYLLVKTGSKWEVQWRHCRGSE
jgi:hypothetical protein